MLKLLTMLAIAVLTSLPARATVSLDIGINVPAYPTLQRIPGYPVYYVPHLHANYFFYDGLYWVYVPDGWYASPWYDGPWDFVPIDSVPLFILRVPVRYYGYPPVVFRGWATNAPPRWDSVWGPDWARRHQRWQHWNRAATPPPAPLPRYQQRFTRANYPDDSLRRELTQRHYRYTPRDKQARQQWAPRVDKAPRANAAPALRHAPPHRTQPAPPEPHRLRVEAPQAGSFSGQARAEERQSARTARHEHGGHPDMPRKDGNDGGHERGKHH